MVIGIRPTVDFAFKLIFGSPEHSRVTIHFLNSILGNALRIASVQIQNPFLGKENEDDKISVLDILATDEHGRWLNIEVQTTLPAGIGQRLAYCTAGLYSGQMSAGDAYTALHPAINVCVLAKPMFPEVTDLHLKFHLRSESGLVLTDDLQIHLLQLSKLTVTAENVSRADPIEQWAFFMLNADKLTMDDIKRLFADPEFAEAAGVLEMISKTPDQQMRYDARLKFQLDEAARMEQALREGEMKGRREGELLGTIKVLQMLLGIPVPTPDELAGWDEKRLSEFADQLQQQLRSRGL